MPFQHTASKNSTEFKSLRCFQCCININTVFKLISLAVIMGAKLETECSKYIIPSTGGTPSQNVKKIYQRFVSNSSDT